MFLLEKTRLKKLLKELIKREDAIVKALHNDFKKSEYEACYDGNLYCNC